MTWFTVCVIGAILIGLSPNGTAFTKEEWAVAASEIQRIGESLNYPRSAIETVITTMLQTNTSVDERTIGVRLQKEQTVLIIEGALYQTRDLRLSSDTRQYNVRNSLKKMEETISVDTTTWTRFDEDKLTILRQQIESEFPKEVADVVVKLTREQSNQAKTAEQAAKFAMDWLTLLLDGAAAINTKFVEFSTVTTAAG